MKYKHRLWRATPSWANIGAIYGIYNKAQALREQGIDAQVDHIYPLAGETVCGLHVAENLQIVLGSDNSKKRNTLFQISALPAAETPQLELFT